VRKFLPKKCLPDGKIIELTFASIVSLNLPFEDVGELTLGYACMVTMVDAPSRTTLTLVIANIIVHIQDTL
jgi:hypothetical protein